MADLLAHRAPAAPKLTIAHQGLAAALAAINAAVPRAPADDAMLTILRDVLPHAHGDGEVAQALIRAAKALLSAYGSASVDWREWCAVDGAVQFAVALYYRPRAALTHSKIFPETQAYLEAAHAE